MADPQAFSYEFAQLESVTFRGESYYELPIDSSKAGLVLTSYNNGISEDLPIYGRFTLYLDDHMRAAFPMTPNVEYQQRAIKRFTSVNGDRLRVDVTYGSLTAELKIRAVEH